MDIAEARGWVRSRLPTSGELEHVQTEPWATVFRVPVDAGVAWFKACSPHQGFEVPLTAALSERWPDVVADVIAHDAERRWLLIADAGDPLRVFGNPPERWLEVLPRYAEIQIGETERVPEHLASGVPDLRIRRLPALAEELVRTDLPIPAEEVSGLERSLATFASLCDELDDAGIRPSIQHDDLHMNNVYIRDGVLRILDWGDASVGHPFFSLFETFRFLQQTNGLGPDDAWFALLRDAYLEPWGSGHGATFDLALRVAGLAHGIAWLRQRDELPPADRAGFDVAFAVILRMGLDGLLGGSER